MLDNLKIQEKLIFGFGTILVLMLIMAAIGLTQILGVKKEVESMADSRYPKVVLGSESIKRTIDNGRVIRNAVLSGDSAEIESFIAQSEANRQANSAALGKIEKLLETDKGKDAFAKVVAARDVLSKDYEKMYALLRSQDDAGAVAYLKSDFAPANNSLIAAIEDMNKLMSDYMDEGKANAAGAISLVQTSMLTALCVALILGTAIAYLLSHSLSIQIESVVRRSEKIAEGDFSASEQASAAPSTRTEIGRLLASQEKMRVGLIHTMEEIRKGATQVSDSAHELASVSEQVAVSVQKQADSTSSASATLEELAVSIDHVSDNATDASKQSSLASEQAQNGMETVGDSIRRIETVSASAQQTYTEIAELQEEVTKIGNIVTVIRDVADQTNLLALNAAIEAARAGESGRGFAVVADEVRKLAERTATSAQEITATVCSIQTNAQRVVASVESNQQSVSSMTDSSARTAEVIQGVQSNAQEVLHSIANINTALGEQRMASQDLAKTMETVAQMAEGNSATVEELATTSHVLMDLSSDLKKAIGHFRW